MSDIFNNSNNNYVNPGFSPCAGSADDSYLEFGNKSIDIYKGSNILAGLSFSDVQIPVSSYSTQKKVLEPGEVTFISGLTKGLNYRSQFFTLPEFTENDLNPYFMKVDLSIGFYKNFKYNIINLEASGNYAENITIDQALSIAFTNVLAKISSTYDPSWLGFSGTMQGWDYSISNVGLTLIDASQNSVSPFETLIVNDQRVDQKFTLVEDLDKQILYAKYPNSAMQGIILKTTYPAEQSYYNRWIYINHVSDMATIYEPTIIDNYISSIEKTNIVTFDSSIIFGPFIGDASGATMEGLDVSDGLTMNQYARNCVFSYQTISDSSIYASQINLTSDVIVSWIENSWINASYPLLPQGLPASRVSVSSSLINESSVNNALLTDVSIYNSFLEDVSLVGCTLYNCSYDPSTISLINCFNIRINENVDVSIAYTFDSSIFYKPTLKTIEVGMNGSSTSTAMSAGDYLDWITENEAWSKVGDMYIWTSAPDAEDTKNLIDGFYVFNPQEFSIQIEYLIFV